MRFRAIIRRVQVSHETVEFEAVGIHHAAEKARLYAEGSAPRGRIVVVRPYDQDPKATDDKNAVEVRVVEVRVLS